MEKRQGVFIALEGTDGSGKGTQFKLLADFLRQQGYDVETFDFPQYDLPSSYFVKEYLNGAYGNANEVGPYTSSLFYALDRYQAAPRIRAALKEGKVVLSNRFTGSSMGHQGTKFAHAEERRGFFIWLDNLEFEMLRIPRPDVSLVLRVPADIAQQLVDQKEQRTYTDKKRDIHEADLTHLERAVAVYDDLCQLFPKDFQRIDCVRGGQLMPIEAVQEILRQKVVPLLPAPSAAQTSAAAEIEYFMPDSLDPATQKAYRSHMDELQAAYQTLSHELSDYVARSGGDPQQVARVLRAIVPVAKSAKELPAAAATPVKKLTDQYLPATHTTDLAPLKLTGVWPRNEFDLVPMMAYQESNLPLSALKTQIDTWTYDQKLALFEAYFAQPSDQRRVLQEVHYTWDLLEPAAAQQALRAAGVQITTQTLTPRYGYDVPALIEQAGLTEQFERCFEISLALYSLLQANGYTTEAQYATLLGHKQRFSVRLTAQQLLDLKAQKQDELSALLTPLAESITSAHPLLGELFV